MTEQEKVILQNVESKFKYITRDENGDLFVFAEEPRKGTNEWINENLQEWANLNAFNHLFENVKWEDEEPTLIADLLNPKKEEYILNKTMVYKLMYWEKLLQRDSIYANKVVLLEIKSVLKNYKEVKE